MIIDQIIFGAGGRADETVTVKLLSLTNTNLLTGVTITLSYEDITETKSFQGSDLQFLVPAYAHYTISSSELTDFKVQGSQSFIAAVGGNRTVSFQYRRLGIFILNDDESIFTVDNWNSSCGKAVGIYCGLEDFNCVLALEDASTGIAWSSNLNLVSSCFTTTSNEDKDVNSKLNTDAIISSEGYANAAGVARNYTWENGEKGDLPSLGVLFPILQNKSKINTLLKVVGTELADADFWSSTQRDAEYSYAAASSYTRYSTKTTLYHVRSVYSL